MLKQCTCLIVIKPWVKSSNESSVSPCGISIKPSLVLITSPQLLRKGLAANKGGSLYHRIFLTGQNLPSPFSRPLADHRGDQIGGASCRNLTGPIRNRSLSVPFWPAKRSMPPSPLENKTERTVEPIFECNSVAN